MFLAVQLILGKAWKQPVCSSANKGIKKIYLLHYRILFCYKKDKLESIIGERWDLENHNVKGNKSASQA